MDENGNTVYLPDDQPSPPQSDEPYIYNANQDYNNNSDQPYIYNSGQQQPSNLYVPNDYSGYADSTSDTQPQQQNNPWNFSSWFTPQQQPDNNSNQWDQSNYTYGQQAQQPSNLYDFSGYADSTSDTSQSQQPSNLSVPDGFKSDGSVSSMYEQESQQPDYRYNAYGQPTSQWARTYYAQNDVPQSGGSNWGKSDYGSSGSFGDLSDWNGTSKPPDQPIDRTQGDRYFEPQQNQYSGLFASQNQNVSDPFIEGLGKDPLQAVNNAVGVGLQGAAGVLSNLGRATDAAADSGIPGLSQAGQGIRFGWEQAVEPAGNLLSSTVGALSQGGSVLDLLHGAGPFGAVVGGAADILQGRDPTQYYKNVAAQLPLTRLISDTNGKDSAAWQTWRNQQVQAEYDNQIASGVSPAQAEEAARRLGEKLLNPLNAAEYSGMQSFSKLPAPAQLVTMFADPLGNKVYGGALHPLTKGIPGAIGKAADATGVSAKIDNILENTVRAPDQRAYKFGVVADQISMSLKNSLDAVDGALPEPDVMRLFLKTPDSPLYYANVLPDLAKDPRKQAVIAKLDQMYDASPVADLSKPDTAVTGGKLGTGQSELGVKAQDTTGAVDPNASNVQPIERPPAEPGTVDPKQATLDAQSQADFNAIKSANPVAEPTKLPDTYKPIKLPDRQTGGIDEFFGAAKTAQAVDVKALKLDNTLKNPGYRPAKKLEEWGPLGSAIRGVDKYTVQPVSRVYLETLSRAVRDPLSNYTKLAVIDPGAVAGAVFSRFGIGDAQKVADRFKTIFGDVEPLGHASMSADVGGGRTGKESGVGNLAYHIANPFNELTADVLRGVTKGKFQSYTKFIEDNETLVKQLLYKREALRIYDEAVQAGPKTEFFQQNPWAYKAIQDGTMTMGMLDRLIQGRVFKGFDLNDLTNNKYNPSMPSEDWHKEAPGVADGTAGPFGQELNKGIGSLSDRVKAENKRQVVEYLRKSGYRVGKDGDLSQVNPKALKNAQANAKLVKFEDLDSNHPIVQQMVEDVVNAYDTARAALFPKDNKLYDTAMYMVNTALNYARDSGRFDMFSHAFKDAQDMRETYYNDKYKAPPTDFEKMMALKDKYEATADLTPQEIRALPPDQRLTPKQIKEYEAWRDSQPIRQRASDAGVELPSNESLFSGAKTLDDYKKIIKTYEPKNSVEFDNSGGDPLRVKDPNHQAQLAEALFNKDLNALNQLIDDVKHDPRYEEGVVGKGKGKFGTDKDRSGANTDRVVERIREYWNDANTVDTGSPGLPQPTPQPKADYTDLYNKVNNPLNVRFKADQTRGGKASGMVLTPEKMRQMASKFNRTETFTTKGDVYNKATDRTQMNRWFQDFVATDEYYRKISNNTFKLDPETLGPVRIADGISLDELTGRPAPEKIGPTIPPLPEAAKDLNGRELLEQIKAKLGDDAQKNFDEMDPVQADIYRQQLAREIFGVDPLNPLTNPKGSAEHAKGTELLQKYLDDMDSRKAKYESDTATGAAKTGQYNLDMQKVTQSLMAERFQATLKAREGAYQKVKDSYFDYRDKNRIDQVLGTVLPFQYWARQNFAFLARHFAANPYHFAAILNYYKQQEQQNSDPTIPGYAKSNMHIADVSPGVHLMWDNSSMNPFNPFGNNQIMGGLVMMDDNQFEAATQGGQVANSEPFGVADIGKFIFGKDIVSKTQLDPKTGKPKVIGRDKGLLGSWLNPNPAIKDSLLQTGLFNKAVSGLIGSDQTTFGQDYPEETRAAHASTSLFPAGNLYAAAASATPVAGALRNAGIIKGEFNPAQPFNEMLYGRNAGKQTTAIKQEIVRMTRNGEINEEQGKLAVAAYNDGSYNSVPLLAAIDRVYADTLGLKMASQIGFSAQLVNTPRQQITNKLYDDTNKAFDQLPTGYSLDDKGNAVANKSAVSKFYKDNPAADVLSTTQANDTPESIRQGVSDSKTFDAIDKLKAQRKDGSIDYPTYTAELNKLQGANPSFFEKYPYYNPTPGEAKYQNLVDQYKAIGGQNFDDIQAKAFAAKDQGDEAGYKKLINSPEYKAASNERLQFLLQNPDFQKQYTANNDQYARERTQEVVGGVGRSNPQLAPKPQRTIDDLQYTKTTNDYYDIGGDKFDKLQTQAYAAKDNGDDATYKKIVSSPEYQQAQDKRNQFIFDNPDWYKTYSDNSVAHGGTQKNQGPLPSQELPRLTPKPPRSIDDIKQAQITSKYYAIGGNDFDAMQKKAYDARDKGDEATFTRILASPEYQAAQKKRNDFIIDNEDWYNKYSQSISDKKAGGATQATLRGGTTPQIIPGGTLARPKTIPDIKYSQQLSEYYSKGGDKFDQLEAEKNKYFDAKQDSKAYDIINSREYQQVKSAQEVFKRDNPDFAKRYDAEYQQKYGKPPKNEADQIYDEQKAQFYKIGGARYDQLYKQAQDAFNSGDKKTGYAVEGTREYKAMQAARDQYLIDNPDFAQKYNADNLAKYGTTPKSDADKEYADLNNQYQSIGGAKYDALYALANEYYDAGNKAAYNAIAKSKDYIQAKAARQQFLDDNPEFATRYKAETEAKYGPAKTSTTSSTTGSNSSSNRVTYANSSSGRSTRTSAPKKTTGTAKKSTSSASSKGTASSAVGSSAPFTNAQKAAYAYARNTLGYSSTQAAGYARKVPAAQPSFHKPGTTTTTKSVAALPTPTTSSVKTTKTVVDSTKSGTYNQGKSSVPTTLRSVASLPLPVRSGGGGGSSKPKKAPSVPIHNFLPGPNTSLVKFSKRKRYK